MIKLISDDLTPEDYSFDDISDLCINVSNKIKEEVVRSTIYNVEVKYFDFDSPLVIKVDSVLLHLRISI